MNSIKNVSENIKYSYINDNNDNDNDNETDMLNNIKIIDTNLDEIIIDTNNNHYYRSDIEGLRGLSIILVLLFHANILYFKNGFVGVDCFYVISGYVITQNLIKEYNNTNTINLYNFYSKRFLRLLPASTLVLLVTLFTASFIFHLDELRNYLKDMIAASTCWVNMHFAASTGSYWHSLDVPSPILHFWSLAVEEQFYLFWPFIFYCLPLTPSSYNRLGFLTLLIISSLGCYFGFDDNYSFYSLPARAWQLVIGSLIKEHQDYLQSFVKFKYHYLLTCIGVIGIVAISMLDLELKLSVFLTVLCTVLILVSSDKNWFAESILSNSFFMYFGKHSYSFYLWHWGPLVFLNALWSWKNNVPYNGTAFICLTSYILIYPTAVFSYDHVENSFRTNKFLSKHGFVIGLLLMLVCFAIGNGGIVFLNWKQELSSHTGFIAPDISIPSEPDSYITTEPAVIHTIKPAVIHTIKPAVNLPNFNSTSEPFIINPNSTSEPLIISPNSTSEPLIISPNSTSEPLIISPNSTTNSSAMLLNPTTFSSEGNISIPTIKPKNRLLENLQNQLKVSLTFSKYPENLKPRLTTDHNKYIRNQFFKMDDYTTYHFNYGNGIIPYDVYFDHLDTKESIALIGDSHSQGYIEIFWEWAKKKGIKFYLMSYTSCQWAGASYSDDCTANREGVRMEMEKFKPTFIVGASWFRRPYVSAKGHPDYDVFFASISKYPNKMLMIEDQPAFLHNIPPKIMSHPNSLNTDCTSDIKDALSLEYGDFLEELSKTRPNTYYLRTREYFCYEGKCPCINNNIMIYFDNSHLTKEYLQLIKPVIYSNLLEIGFD